MSKLSKNSSDKQIKAKKRRIPKAFPELSDTIASLADEAYFAGVLEFDENGCYKIETLVEDYYYDLAFNSENRKEICETLENYLIDELHNSPHDKYLRLLPAAVHILTLNGKIKQAITLREELTATIVATMWDQYNHIDYNEALNTADELLSINADNFDALYVKALCLSRLDEYNNAETILNDLIETDEQQSARYYYALGRIQKRQGNYDNALEFFNIAISKNIDIFLHIEKCPNATFISMT